MDLELARQVRHLLAERDRSRRSRLFSADRAVQADDAFTRAIVKLIEDHANTALKAAARAHREELDARARAIENLTRDLARASAAPGAPQAPAPTAAPSRAPKTRAAAVTAPRRAKPAAAKDAP